jgi:hypothetical protein
MGRDDTAADTRPVPPEILAAALSALPAGADPAAAALQLALPVGELLGLHADVDDRSYRWRGCSVERSASPAHDVASLIEAARRDGDTWRWPLGDDPVRWARFVRCGTRVVAWAAPALYGGGRVTFDPVLGDAGRAAVLAHVIDGGTSPAVLSCSDASAVLVEGGPGWSHANASRNDERPRNDIGALTVRLSAADLVRRVAGVGVAHVVEGEDPSRFEVHATLRCGTRIVVPVRAEAHDAVGGVSIGAHIHDLDVVDGDIPAGWDLAGSDAVGRRVVARSGLHALLA